MRRGRALTSAVSFSALLGVCLAIRPPAGGVVLARSHGRDIVLPWTEQRGASSLAAVGGGGFAAGSSIGAEEDSSHLEWVAGGAFAVLLAVAVSCYCSGSCIRLRREARTWHGVAAPAGSVHILHQCDEACLRTAASVAATLRGLGCTVTGADGSEGGDAALPAEADLALCVLTPTIFAVDAARSELLRARGLGIPVIPVHAGDQFPRDALTPMISCSPSELVGRDFPQGDEEADVVHEIRRYVFRENIRDVDNSYHAKACVSTVRLLAQRAAEAQAQRVQDVPSNHYKHDVFISYNSRDAWEVFESIAAIFEGLGLEVFNPSKDLQRTEVSMAEMIRHVKGSRFLIQVNTPHYVSSKWCRAELLAAAEAGIPIHSVFAGKKSTGRQLLDLLNTPAEPSIKDKEGIDEARACILEAIGRRGMVDAYNPDFAEEAVDDLQAIAYRHIAWLRWTRRLKFFGIGLTICLLVALVVVSAAMVLVAEMEKDCVEEKRHSLDRTLQWFDNTIMRALDPGCFQRARECMHRLNVSRWLVKVAKAGAHEKVNDVFKTVTENMNDGQIVFEGLLTVSQLAHANLNALRHFPPAWVCTAMRRHGQRTWLLMQANTLLLQFASIRWLPDVCGFVRCLVKVLEDHLGDVRLQQRTLQVLRGISSRFADGDNTVQTCAEEAFKACLNAMRNHQSVEGVQDHGALCLRNLARWVAPRGGFLMEGATLAVQAMQVHENGSAVVLASAAQALLQISNYSQEVQVRLSSDELLVRVLLHAANSTSGGEFPVHTSHLLQLLSVWAASGSLPGMDEQDIQTVIGASLRRATDARAADYLLAMLRQLVAQPPYRPMLFKHGAMSAATAAISAQAGEPTVLDAVQILHALADYGIHEENQPALVRDALANASRKAGSSWDVLSQAVRGDLVALFAFVAERPFFQQEWGWLDSYLAKQMIKCLGSSEDGEKLQASIMQLWILLAQDAANVETMHDMSAATRLLPVLASNTSEATAILALDLLARLARTAWPYDLTRAGLIPIVYAKMDLYRNTMTVQCMGMDVLRHVTAELRCEDVTAVLPALGGVGPGDLSVLKSEVGLLRDLSEWPSHVKCIGNIARGSLGNIMAVMRGMPADLSLQIDAVVLVTQLLPLKEVWENTNATAGEYWAALLLAACQAHPESDDLQLLAAANLQAWEQYWRGAKTFQHVLPLVLDMMRAHGDSEALQVLALRLLDRTASNRVPQPDYVWLGSPEECGAAGAEAEWLSRVKDCIGASEAVPLILRAMGAFPLNMTIQTRAGSLLKALAAGAAEKLVEAGAVRYLLPSNYKVRSNDINFLRQDVFETVRLRLSLCALHVLSSQIRDTGDQLVEELKMAGTEDAMTIQGRSELAREVFSGRRNGLEDNCENYYSMLDNLIRAKGARSFMVQRGFLKAAKLFLVPCMQARSMHRGVFLDIVSSLAGDNSTSPLLVRDGAVAALQRLLPEYHWTMSTKPGCIEDAKKLDKLMLKTLTDLAQAPDSRKQMLRDGAFAIAYVVAMVLHPEDLRMLGLAARLLALLAGEPESQADPDRQLAGEVLRAASARADAPPDTRLQAEAALKLIGEPTKEGVAAALSHSPLVTRLAMIPQPRC